MIPEPRATLQGAATWRFQDVTLCLGLRKWGKKTAWKVWETYNEFTDAFYETGLHNFLAAPQQISEEIEKFPWSTSSFCCMMTATCASINDVRKLFTRKGREMLTLPPCKAALQQHVSRAVLQSGHCNDAAPPVTIPC